MLNILKIKNFALLKDVTIEFDKGLNILTGETGAGKSIIIGALDICVGERGYTENIRTGEEKAEVEAVFDFEHNSSLKPLISGLLSEAGIEPEGASLVIKREINRSAKGKIFINNSASSLSFLQKLGKLLIDIHGQHEHQSLLKSEIHINLLDDYAAAAAKTGEVKKLYDEFTSLETEIKKLKALENEKQEKLDAINYRINEIEQASFSADDELETLLRDREIMAHSEGLKDSVNGIIMLLSPAALDLEGEGAADKLVKAQKHLAEIGKVDKKTADEYSEILSDAAVKAEEIKNFFAEYKDRIDFDPQAMRDAEDRIELIETLMKKYKKGSIKDIKGYYEELKQEKEAIEVNEDTIKEKEAEFKKLNDTLYKKCTALSEERKKRGKELSAKIQEELKELGISKGVFEVKITNTETTEGTTVSSGSKSYKLMENGIDEAEFLISLNPGEDVKPLVKIASGGEVSRIMLAIKNILSDVDRVDVMVFDEIDTGISGKVASAVGAKLSQISGKKQLICITHLPQIAAYSDLHYSVGKKTAGGKTETTIQKLTAKEKTEEVAKLLSGENVTEASLKAAEELIGTVNSKTKATGNR